MSKEITDIVRAFREAQRHGRQTALATVVHVEGSSYRRPGARMLVEDTGRMTGAISGGCLEGDALRRALQAIHQRENKLVTYNTLHEDDVEFGVQLGCNGIVHILFEPIRPEDPDNPVALLERFLEQRTNAVVVTLFSLEHYHGAQRGTCFFANEAGAFSKIEDNALEISIGSEAARVLASNSSLLRHYADCGITAFAELLQPPVSLVVAGAGNDALPLVDMAALLGWQTTVVDGRATHATRQRFPKAQRILVGKPSEIVPQLAIDDRTVFVLLTHNFNYDLELLSLLLEENSPYIGVLGPKKRLERLLAALEERGRTLTDEHLSAIFGPTGLDLGAEGAEEIALSVLAEIKAVLAGRPGSFLRDRPERIHVPAATVANSAEKAAW